MQKEIIKKKTSSLTINVVATKAESLRKVVEDTTTVRVYENGNIGVAGQVGKADVCDVEKQAIDNLALEIAYPCDLTKNTQKAVDARKNVVDTAHFVKIMQNLLAKLEKEIPSFLFSNKITYRENETEYSNSENTALSHAGNELDIVLCIKSKTSANIMDFAYAVDMLDYDEDKVVADIKSLCDAYDNKIDWQDGKYVVVASGSMFYGDALGNFSGELYASGASLFKDCFGQKVFNEKVTLELDPKNANNVCFFDAEGTLLEGDDCALIKNGVFERVLANKKISAQFSLPRIACSAAAYDSIPAVGASGLRFKNTHKSILDAIGNEKAIYIVEASGGDMTTSGDYATPCEVALLIENGKFVGRLPKINLFGNVKEFLGDDFVGASDKGLFNYQDSMAVAKMNVSLI